MFKVVGRSVDNENVTIEVSSEDARNSKQIYNYPENYGLSKVYKVTAISNRKERKEDRDAKYT